MNRTRPFALPLPFRTGLLLVFVAATLAGAPGLRAQVPGSAEDPFEIPGVVATASQIPLAVERLPTRVTVVTRDEIEAAGYRTVAEALRTVPGLAIASSGPAGAQTSVFLRGGESDYVKVLVDGVPLNEAGGAIDLADLSTDQVERIEVVRGPASVLHGSDAVTGVIQIFTVRGRGAPRLQVTATGGAGERRHADERHGVLDAEATLSGSSGRLSYAVGGGHSWSSGTYPFNNQNRLSTGSVRLGWTDGSNSLGLSARLSDGAFHFPTDGSGTLADENQVLDRRGWSLAANAGRRLGARWEARAELTVVDRHQITSDAPDGPEDTSGVVESVYDTETRRLGGDLRVTGEVGRAGTLTVGGGHEVQDGRVAYDSDGEYGPYSAGASHDRSGSALYAELLSEAIRGLSLTLGVRSDWNETFGRFDAWRAGFSWSPIEGTRLRGGLGRAFREPTFGEHYGSGFFDVGNEDLDPERTFGWELGVEREVGPAILSATWFDQRFEDLIQYTSTPPNPGDPNYYNVGAADASGLEVEAEGTLGPVGLALAYTFLHTEVLDPGLTTDAGFVEGEPLLRRPRHSGSASLDYARGPFRGGVVLNLVGERADADFGQFPSVRVELPEYATVDVSLSYGLAPRGLPGTLLLRIENLLDADYAQVLGFPAEGRVVRLGASVEVGG